MRRGKKKKSMGKGSRDADAAGLGTGARDDFSHRGCLLGDLLAQPSELPNLGMRCFPVQLGPTSETK